MVWGVGSLGSGGQTAGSSVSKSVVRLAGVSSSEHCCLAPLSFRRAALAAALRSREGTGGLNIVLGFELGDGSLGDRVDATWLSPSADELVSCPTRTTSF